jgi:hypothetical protein
MTSFKRWEEHLDDLLAALRQVHKSGDLDRLRAIAIKSPRDGRGLIVRWEYERCPEWLQHIWYSGACWYLFAIRHIHKLWDIETNQPRFSVRIDMGVEELGIDRCEEGLVWIKELNSLFADILPMAYLESPISDSVDDLMDRPSVRGTS